MTCVCGHSEDMHDEALNGDGPCIACDCRHFEEDIDRDELEKE